MSFLVVTPIGELTTLPGMKRTPPVASPGGTPPPPPFLPPPIAAVFGLMDAAPNASALSVERPPDPCCGVDARTGAGGPAACGAASADVELSVPNSWSSTVLGAEITRDCALIWGAWMTPIATGPANAAIPALTSNSFP